MTLDPLYPDIALYGAPGSGKSTGALFLVKLGYVRVSVAGYHKGGVRDIALRLWGEGADADREKLNALGNLRSVDPDVFARNYWHEFDRQHEAKRVVVTDDFRGQREWDKGHAHGMVFVHVTAPDEVRIERLRRTNKLDGADWSFLHELEDTERYHPDHVVMNDGSEDELYEALTDVLNIERSRRA